MTELPVPPTLSASPEAPSPDGGEAPVAPRAQARFAGRGWTWATPLIFATAALAFTIQAHVESKVPLASDWAPVWAHLAASWQPGDGLTIVPSWAAYDGEGLRSVFLKHDVRQDAFFVHASPLTPADLARPERLWVLAPRGDSLDGVELSGGAELHGDLAVRSGTIGLFLAPRPFPPPTFDALAELATADVARTHPGGRIEPCRWAKDEHRCDGRWWTAVRRTIGEVGNTRRRVVFAHAHPSGGLLTIRYPGVAVGARLRGGIGLFLASVRREEGSDTDVRILLGGEVAYQIRLPRGDFAWHEVDVDSSRFAAAPTDITVEIEAADSAWRQVAFDLVSH